MPRSPLQPGPETRHYHDTLGVDEQVPGGVQTVSLLGPFTVTFDTPGLEGGTAVISPAQDANAVLIKAWAVMREDFIVLDNLEIYVSNVDGSASYTVTHYNGPDFPDLNTLEVGPVTGQLYFAKSALFTPYPYLCVGAFPTAGNFTEGAFDVYALIATPS
jgi:hypothetical protein